MASKGRKKASLSGLSRERFSNADFSKIGEELSQGSDRAAAIVGAAYVEILLTDALNVRFQMMSIEDAEALFYSPTAPLQPFSAKIKLGHAIGIYGVKLKKQLETTRRIRNVFAHSVRPREFNHPLIKKELDTLRDISLADVTLVNLDRLVSRQRAKFLANCMDITLAFDIYARKRYEAGIGITVDFQNWDDDAHPPLLHKSI